MPEVMGRPPTSIEAHRCGGSGMVARLVVVVALVLGIISGGVATAAAASPVARQILTAATSSASGYWLLTANGGVTAFGGVQSFGSLQNQLLSASTVCMSSTVDGRGYWLVASDGGVFSFGDAGFHGSLGAAPLNAPIVGMAPTADGRGYWLAASDGGVFSFGDARFSGSLGGSAIPTPVIGLSVPGRAGSCMAVSPKSNVPAPIPPPGPRGPAGEGLWSPAGRPVGTSAAVYTTVLRPFVGGQAAGIAWIDTSRSRLRLYAGPPSEPHGSFANSSAVAPSDRPGLLAAFNSGFQVAQSNGGWYSEGQMAVALRDGAASLVITTSGAVKIGMWGRDFSLTPDVSSVRQNLTLLVDHGQPAGDINSGGDWGAVIGGVGNTWRSGVGVDAQGNLIYVAGPDLLPTNLAHLLIEAGATEGMELDINPMWPVFTTYQTVPGLPASVVAGTNLLGGMFFGTNHFITADDRDFFAVLSR